MDAPNSTRETRNRNGGSGSPDRQGTLGSDELRRINAYWRAAKWLGPSARQGPPDRID